MTTLEQLQEKIGGKIWEKDGKKRIYLDRGYNTKKMSTSTYVYQDEQGNFLVSCFINCPSQEYGWVTSQKDQIIRSVNMEIREAIADTYYYVIDADGDIIDDCCRTPKNGLIDMYVGGGLYVSESLAKGFIRGEELDGVEIKSISRKEFETLTAND